MAAVREPPAPVSGSKRAGKTDRDLAAENDPDLVPPSPSRVFGYRAWFAAILFLEYAIVRKQIQAYMAFDSFRGTPRLMRHPWVSIATHVAVDSVALWFLNAFPGSSRCGTRRTEGSEKENEKLILRVPASVPILARHTAKMCSRVQPVVITLLGARVFHGYTLKQTLLMVLSPTFFNVVGGAKGRNALATMSAVNVAVVLAIVRFNRDAYAGYPDIFRAFQTTLCPERTFYAIGLTAVAAAPFVFAFLTEMDAVIEWGQALWRLHARVYFGGQLALGPETEIHALPSTIVPLARRLRVVARRVVPLAVAANALVLALALFTKPLSLAETSIGVDRALAAALTSCFLAAPARVLWGAFDEFASADEWRDLYEDTRNAAERAAFTLVGSYAALSATACAAVTRNEAFSAAPETTARVAAAWLATWFPVAACACAITPSPAPWRAARAAGLGLAVAAAGVAIIDDATFDAAVAGLDAAALAKALFGAYMCALHAAAAWAAAARGAQTFFCFLLSGASPAPSDSRSTATRLDGHWKPADFEVDASRFRARARSDELMEVDARCDYVPTARAEPLGVAGELAAVARARQLAESDARDSVRRAPRCRAEGCVASVGRSSNALGEGLSLCREHLLAEAPFQCVRSGAAASFCVLCRRVHAPPRCAEGACDGGGRTECEAYTLRLDAPETARLRSRASESAGGVSVRRGGFRDVSLRTWYKTQEGPVTATARMRGVVSDFASALPEGARALHAEMAVRPGCTLLTMDIGARLRDENGAMGSSAGDIAPERGDDEVVSPEEDDFLRGGFARALAAAGEKNGLDGVMDFVAVDPVSGRSSSQGGPEPSSAGFAGFAGLGLSGVRQRLFFNRRAGESRASDAPGDADADTSRFVAFERFGAFGAFGAETHDTKPEDMRSSELLRSKMPVLRSDRYDVLTLPLPPEGYAYVLQCGGTYIPMMIVSRASAAEGGSARTVVAHVTPTNAEGLGFVDLVADVTVVDASPETRAEVSPLVSVAVFLTPSPALAAELSRPHTGARAEHAPMLFNVGAAITGRATGAAVAAADPRDAADVREEIVLHAACAAASMGWSEAVRRIVDGVDADADSRGQAAQSSGAAWMSRGADRGYGTDPMSENPDTATDFSEMENEPIEHEAAELRCAPPELGTRAGATTLLRAACSSGDVATVRVVIAWVVRSFSVVAASDMLAAGDATGIGSDWTPLHAAADAVARATARRCDAASALRAAVEALVVSTDPLSWVAAGRAGASPSAVLRRGGSESEAAMRSGALQKRLAAMDDEVLDELARAVARAVAHLRNASEGRRSRTSRASTASRRDAGDGDVARFARPEEARAHFAAAATAAALLYDGSRAHTMNVGLLSPGSRRAWDALRARALDTDRPDASQDEAKTWLRGGASPAGFPPPTPNEVCVRAYGDKAVAALVLSESLLRFLAFFSSSARQSMPPERRGGAVLLAAVIAAPAVAAAASAFHRRARDGAARPAALAAGFAAEGAVFLSDAFLSPTGEVLGVSSVPRSGVAHLIFWLRLVLALVVSTLAPAKAFGVEASLVAAAFASAGVFGGFESRLARAAATAAAAAAAAAATRRCVPIVSRAHIDKITAEAMFGPKAKAE